MYHVSNYSQNKAVIHFYYKQKLYFGHVPLILYRSKISCNFHVGTGRKEGQEVATDATSGE